MNQDHDCSDGWHDKCYSPFIVVTYPSQHFWICRRCGVEGTDTGLTIDAGEYDRLKKQKEAKGKVV